MTGRRCWLWTTEQVVHSLRRPGRRAQPQADTRHVLVDLTLRGPDGSDRDVRVRAPVGTRLDCVRPHAFPAAPASITWWSGTRPLPDSAVLGGAGLRSGDIIGVGAPVPEPLAGGSALQLRVTAGPGSGQILPLRSGTVVIGRGEGADLDLADPDVSRRHASLRLEPDSITVRDLESRNGTLLDGRPIEPGAAARLGDGASLRCGDSVLMVAALADPPARLVARSDGARVVARAPRPSRARSGAPGGAPADGRPSPDLPAVDFPAPQHAAVPLKVQWTAVLLPALVAVGLALALSNPLFLAFAALGPIAMLGTALSDRLTRRRGSRREAAREREARQTAQSRLDELLRKEARALHRAYPDPAAVRCIVAGPSSRIWERRRADGDALSVRVGLGSRPASIRVSRGSEPLPAPVLQLAPIVADLRAGPLGIAGHGEAGLRAVRSALTQLIALHSPADVELVVLTGDTEAARWRWLRWAPHTVGAVEDDEGRAAVVAELAARLDDARPGGPGAASAWAGRWTVLIIAGAPASPALLRLLHEGRRVGVTSVCVADEPRQLPEGCASVLALDDARPGRATMTGAAASAAGTGAPTGPAGTVLVDGLSPAHAEGAARSLASLTDLGDDAASVPATARLLDLLPQRAPSAEGLAAAWAASRGPCAPFGIAADGAVELDLDRDGPHVLIAGTTGAGKSELLQTLIAGWAATCPPEELSLLLIDYKGGAAFGECAQLPHVSGLVTDLDPRLTERALQSLAAELRRRESVLGAQGAADLRQYRKRAPDGPALPRLVIVIDEFAALVQELPGFLTGLVGVAARGRSLGVHLVLATQRPAGAVSPDIRANTTLRIALRMSDASESADVVGSPLAASLPRDVPGRGYLRRSPAEPLVQFQAASITVASGCDEAPVAVQPLDDWNRPSPIVSPGSASDLTSLVAAARQAAAGRPRPRPPWQEPLPLVLPADDPRLIGAGAVAIGLLDRPERQSQEPVKLDLRSGGSLLLAGAARSGRTSALRLIAGLALAGDRSSTGDGDSTGEGDSASEPVHLYVVDCAGGGLAELAASPRCGAYLGPDEPDAIALLVRRLLELARSRRSSDPARRPPLLLVIDGAEQLMALLEEADPGIGPDALVSLLRMSGSVAVTVVLAGDRPALASRLGPAVATKLLLRLNDPADYALAGVPARLVPGSMPPGRALLAPAGEEVHLAVLGGAQEALQRAAAAAAAARVLPVAAGLMRIRALPARVGVSEIASGCAAREAKDSGRWVLVGVGGDDARPIEAPLLAAGSRAVIAGPAGSGRSTTLRLIAQAALAVGRRVVEVLPPSSAGSLWDSPAGAPGRCAARQSIGWDDVAALAGVPHDAVLLLDDVAAVADTPVGQALARWGADSSCPASIIGAGRPADLAMAFRALPAALLHGRRGLLLCPQAGDDALLGVAAPRMRGPIAPGRGVLFGFGPTTAVQVALP